MKPLPNGTHARVREAYQILVDVGMPRGQQNVRTALVVLALAGMSKTGTWSAVSGTVRLGITEMMDWMAKQYRQRYAPNTRETVRRQSVHQLIAAGLVRYANQDLATNSPDHRYQLTSEFAALVRTAVSAAWAKTLARFAATHGSLAERYARERTLNRIPVRIRTAEGEKQIELSVGGQSPLIKRVVEDFAPCFTPGAHVVYLGDTGKKHLLHDRESLAAVGITTEEHGKMPDVILLHQKTASERWLVLVEAVTSHGPMNQKRIDELDALFAGCTLGKVFITAFPDRRTMAKHLGDLAWETEVWIAENPTHLIHLNGDRFLGPHIR